MAMEDGTLAERNKGTPQGGVVSPLLANLFLHYALDAWLVREHPGVEFCRYADDGVIHCRSHAQAVQVMREVGERLRGCGLEMHLEKSRIVYCRDSNRRGDHPVIEFAFLGYSFRPRQARGRDGRVFLSFLPAVSRDSLKAMRQKVRSWNIPLKSGLSHVDLSRLFNPVLKGWANYYGRFYATALNPLWKSVNKHLARWLMRKHKRLRDRKTRAGEALTRMARSVKSVFVHWRLGYCYT